MIRDVRLAARMMLQSRGWTAVVLVSLALGIGANTALFSAMNGLLFRKVPVADPDSLVRLRSVGRNQMRTDTLVYGFSAQDAHGRRVDPTFSYPMYRQLVGDNLTLSDLFAFAPIGDVNLVVNGQADSGARCPDQPEVLAPAVRRTFGRYRLGRARQQHAGHDRRRAAAGIHGRPAGD